MSPRRRGVPEPLRERPGDPLRQVPAGTRLQLADAHQERANELVLLVPEAARVQRRGVGLPARWRHEGYRPGLARGGTLPQHHSARDQVTQALVAGSEEGAQHGQQPTGGQVQVHQLQDRTGKGVYGPHRRTLHGVDP